MNGWTPERRRKHSEAIHRWKPWEKSTGPKTDEGKAVSSQNGFRGGRRPALRALSRVLGDQRSVLSQIDSIDKESATRRSF